MIQVYACRLNDLTPKVLPRSLSLTRAGAAIRFAPRRQQSQLSAYVRSELYRGDGQRAILTNIPDYFVNLEPEMRNPTA